MSVSNVTVQQTYAADGMTLTFAIPFAYPSGDADGLTKVYVVDSVTGIKTLKTEGALNDYTLTPTGDNPTQVLFNVAPVSPNIVFIRREMPYDQAVSFVNSGQMLLTDIQLGIDGLCFEIQQVAEKDKRAVHLNDIQLVSSFDLTLPLAIVGSSNACLGTNLAGDGFEIGPTFGEIESAEEYADDALASQLAAAASAAAAAASAAAAAISAANMFVSTRFAVTDAQAATDLLGEVFDGTVITSVNYWYELIRGTTVIANGVLSMQYKNGTWGFVLGEVVGDEGGLTFTVSQATTFGQLRLALDAGAGNGTIKFKKITNLV